MKSIAGRGITKIIERKYIGIHHELEPIITISSIILV